MFDTLIENGTVVDGTGALWYRAAVGIQGATMTILRGDTTSCDSLSRIDASGRVVCPGFIDVHSHADLSHITKPTNDTKLRQGVTSEVNGNCGIGYVPLSQVPKQSMSHYFGGVTGRAAETSTWNRVAEYLAAVDMRSATNQGFLVPHGCLRLEVVGWAPRAATREETRRMARMLEEAMEEGALGLSTGLTYPPGMWAEMDELTELCQVVRRMGGVYATHVRYTRGDGVLDGFREAISIATASRCRLHISHFYVPAALRGHPEKMLKLIDDARADEVDVTFDAYTYEYGSSTLASILPGWAYEGGPEELVRHLHDEDSRNRIRHEGPPRWSPQDILINSVSAGEDKECEGRILSDIAGARGQDAWTLIFDLLVNSDLEVSFTVKTGDCDDIAPFLQHDAYMVGSDALLVEGHNNPRTYGTFPRVFDTYVRRKRSLNLEGAIRKMTWMPAQRFGLRGRGQLSNNAPADLVVFNPRTIGSSSTLNHPDSFPVGIDHIVVGGVTVFGDGMVTGATPGRALRRESTPDCA